MGGYVCSVYFSFLLLLNVFPLQTVACLVLEFIASCLSKISHIFRYVHDSLLSSLGERSFSTLQGHASLRELYKGVI